MTTNEQNRGVSERWSYWQCVYCGRVQTYPKPPAGPRKPSCVYGHHAQPMVEVAVIER